MTGQASDQQIANTWSDEQIGNAWSGFDQDRRKRLLARMSPEQKHRLRGIIESQGLAEHQPGKALMTPDQFAEKIKAKFPVYKDIPNAELTQKILAKYPVYKDVVISDAAPYDAQGNPTVAPSVYRLPDGGSALVYPGNPIPEGATPIPAKTQVSPNGFLGKLRQKAADWWANETSYGPSTDPMHSNADASFFETLRGIPEFVSDLAHDIHGALPWNNTVRPEQVINDLDPGNLIQSLQDQFRTDWKSDPGMAVQKLAGTLAALGLTAKAGHMAAERGTAGLSKVGELRAKAADTARGALQNMAGAGTGVVRKAVRSAVEKTTADEAARPAQVREHFEEVQEARRHNAALERAASRKEAIADGLHAASQRMGDELRVLDKKVRQEANEKYRVVREATQGESIPANQLTDAVKRAQAKLQGSKENVTIFQDILKRRGADEKPQTLQYGGLDVTPESPLYERARLAYEQEGLPTHQEPVPVTFADLQGYYSELGDRLAAGNLPGDVYQAVKGLRDSIGSMMQRMAEARNAGSQLREAQRFYSDYMRTFHEPTGPSHSGSPVAQALRAEDPKYIRAPFTGSSGARGIEMLAKYDADLAKRVRSLAKLQDEHDSISTAGKPKPIPAKPAKPTAPEVDLQKVRRDALEAAAGRWKLSRYDIGILASSLLAGPLTHFLGGAGPLLREGGIAYVGAKAAFQSALDRPAVIQWLEKPRLADIRAINKIPGADRVKIINGLRDVAKQAEQSGRRVRIATAAAALIGAGSASVPRNRKEALQSLGQTE